MAQIENRGNGNSAKSKVETAQPITPSNTQNSDSSGNKNAYVQDADPETGISWDGKSHIVYTYTDGTKGSEKKDGASYEVSPGVTRIYYAQDESEWNQCCAVCGRKSGDGKNGTCVRWLMSDMECPYCKSNVKQGECHTCKE